MKVKYRDQAITIFSRLPHGAFFRLRNRKTILQKLNEYGKAIDGLTGKTYHINKDQAVVQVNRSNPGMFGPEAVAAAKKVTRSRTIKEKSTGECGRIIGAGPEGWLKVKWDARDKPTLIKRSEVSLARGIRSKNPIEVQRCTSCGQVFGQTTVCPMCRAGIGVRRNPKDTGNYFIETFNTKDSNARWNMVQRRGGGTALFRTQAAAEKAARNIERKMKQYRVRVGGRRGPLAATRLTTEHYKTNGITEAAAGLQALEYLGGKVKAGGKPRYKVNANRIHAALDEKRKIQRLRVTDQALRRLAEGQSVDKIATDLAPGLRSYFNKREIKAIVQEVYDFNFKKRNPRAKGSRDALGVFHAENPSFTVIAFNNLSKAWNEGQISAKSKKDAIAIAKKVLYPKAMFSRHRAVQRDITPSRFSKNPSVTALSEKFQGEADGSIEKSYAATGAPANLARAGRLVFLKVAGRTIRIPGALVSIAPNEKLWIVGDHAPLFETKARAGEGLDVGEITHICYETAKAHIGNGRTFEYVHEFGEEGGRRPHLVIDHEGMPILRGGDYKIQAEGIVD